MNMIEKITDKLERARKLYYIRNLRWKRDYILALDNSESIKYLLKDCFPNIQYNLRQSLSYLNNQSHLVLENRTFTGYGESELESLHNLSIEIYKYKTKYYI